MSVVLVALATSVLGGCGADDAPPATTSSSTAADSDSQNAQPVTSLSAAAAPLNAASSLTANPSAASDPITQNMQANLAADNQQVAPVMHYAPGDGASSN